LNFYFVWLDHFKSKLNLNCWSTFCRCFDFNRSQFIAVWKTFWTQTLEMSPTKNWVCTVGFDVAKNYCFSLFIACLLPYVQSELIHSTQCSLQEVNTAKWINSLGIVHVNNFRWINSRGHCSHEQWLRSSLNHVRPEKKFIYC
jgi:hypothetical protein